MTAEEKILFAWDEHFKNLSAEEIRKDLEIIENIGQVGVSYEEYLYILNTVTAFTLTETGLCDDIAFADFFNRSIVNVQMDQSDSFKVLDVANPEFFDTIVSQMTTISVAQGENTYAMAA